MISWSLTTLIPIFTTLLYGGIFTLVVLTKPRSDLRKLFSVYLLIMFIWSLSAFMSLSGLAGVQPWFNILGAAGFAQSVVIFYFVQSLFAYHRKWAPYIVWYGLLAVVLSLIPDMVFHSVSLDQNGTLSYQFSPMIVFVAGPGFVLMVYSLVELIRGTLGTTHEAERNRLQYLVIGLAIILLAALSNFTELGKYPVDIAANGVTALIIAYAILRHQLLDIRVVVRIGLLYSILTTVLGAFYYLVISLLLNFYYLVLNKDAYSGSEIFPLSVFIALMTAVVLTPLRNQVQTWIDRIFYREKYNAGLMLQRLSQSTASLLDLTKITDLILYEIIQTLHIEHAAIYVKLYQYEDFRVIAENGTAHPTNPKFRVDHPIVQWLAATDEILTKDNLMINPTFKSMWVMEKEDLEDFGAELFIPLTTKGKLVGFLIVGPKRSSEAYSQEDRLTLSTLSNQTAVAVENALLYEELEDTFKQTVVSLANAIDIRDTYTSDHSQHIAQLAADTAAALDQTEEEIDTVYWGGLLHDIGKIGVPDEILNKPSGLTKAEWAIIYQHTIIGAKIISPIKKLAHVAPIIEHSHENFDGSGYPHGIRGEEIPIGARVIRVVDAYSAMIDERPYKQARVAAAALIEIKNKAGTIFDPRVVAAFLKAIAVKSGQGAE